MNYISIFAIENNGIEYIAIIGRMQNYYLELNNKDEITNLINILKHDINTPTLVAYFDNKNSNIIIDAISLLKHEYSKKKSNKISIIAINVNKALGIYSENPEKYLELKSIEHETNTLNIININDNKKEYYIGLAQAIHYIVENNMQIIKTLVAYAQKNNIDHITYNINKLILTELSRRIYPDDMPTYSNLIDVVTINNLKLDSKFIDNDIYNKLKKHKFTNNTFKEQFFIKNISIDISSVGLNYSCKKYYFEPINTSIYEIDFKNFFVRIMLNYELYPHIFKDKKEEFKQQIEKLLEISNEKKHFKQPLLSIIGSMDNKKSNLYSPDMFYSITTNGIFIMIYFIKELLSIFPTINIKRVKIDGIFVEVPDVIKDSFIKYVNELSKIINIDIHINKFSKLYIHDVNNYIGLIETDKHDDCITSENYLQIVNNRKELNNTIFKHNDKYYKLISKGKFKLFNQQIPDICIYAAIYNFVFDGSMLKVISECENKHNYVIIIDNKKQDIKYACTVDDMKIVNTYYVPVFASTYCKCCILLNKKSSDYYTHYIDFNKTQLKLNHYLNIINTNLYDKN